MELTKTLDQTQEKVLLSCVFKTCSNANVNVLFSVFVKTFTNDVKVREKENYISQIVGERNELKRTLDQ